MSLVDYREAAARLQQEAHRQRQRECELEDQNLQKYLRATDELIEARATYDGIAAELSPRLRLELGLVETTPLIETKSRVFVPTVVEPVEPATAKPELKPERTPVLTPAAIPQGAIVHAPSTDGLDPKIAETLEALLGEAINGYAAVEFTAFAKKLSVSLQTLMKRLQALAEENRIQKVKSRFAEPGWGTYRILHDRAAA